MLRFTIYGLYKQKVYSHFADKKPRVSIILIKITANLKGFSLVLVLLFQPNEKESLVLLSVVLHENGQI